MIRRIFSETELNSALKDYPPDVLSGKLKALAKGYGFSYPFLKFFTGEESGAVIGIYYGSAVVAGKADEETREFLLNTFSGEILTSEDNGALFAEFSPQTLYIMEYAGNSHYEKITLKTDASYERVYEILREGFDISFEDWYTDTCHNVRHGISRVFTYNDTATAAEMFSVDGVSLVSLVAVKKSARKTGVGSLLIKNVSENLSKNGKVYVICEKELLPFYEKNGYKIYKKCIQIKAD